MSRQLRRVPPTWEHPRDDAGVYLPMYDMDFVTAARQWMDEAIAWDNGTHPDLVGRSEIKASIPFFWEWDGDPPDPAYYRPAWRPEEATAYQIYEGVSEGSPRSPVLLSLDEVREWMRGRDCHKDWIEQFIRNKGCGSFVALGKF